MWAGWAQSRCGCPHALQVLVIVSEVRPGLKLSKAEIDAVLFAIRAAVGAERATRGNPTCNTRQLSVQHATVLRATQSMQA